MFLPSHPPSRAASHGTVSKPAAVTVAAGSFHEAEVRQDHGCGSGDPRCSLLCVGIRVHLHAPMR